MALVPWQPSEDMTRMRQYLDRWFSEPFQYFGRLMDFSQMRLPVEVFERDGEVVVRAELAGVDPKDVDVRVTDEGVTVRGERKAEVHREHDGTRYSERSFGAFARSIAFPVPVDSAQARASFRHGLLEIRAPKRSLQEGRDGRKLDIELQ